MVAYRVKQQYFNNIYLALHYCWKNGGNIEFYCYDYEYDQFDWKQEPQMSLDDIMIAHAKNLRDSYQRLILLWSGGTDSHTIYNIFKQSKLHIDEIIIKAEKGSMIFPDENYHWLEKNHWDPSTILTKYEDHDTNLRLLDLENEEWVWRDKGDLLKYGMTGTGEGVKFLCEKNHAGYSWRAIGGYEKPRLVYRNGQWHHRQLGMVLQPTMGNDYVEHFFLNPLIAIKQSHMVKKAVKELLQSTKAILYDGDWAEAKWPKTREGYRAWALACGRHDEVNIGVSHTQKNINDNLDKTQLNLQDWRNLHHTTDKRLQHDLLNGNPAALVYIKGLYNLASEQGFVNYLKDHDWFRHNDNCFTSLKFIWSKEYCVGP
jgi:hypothetical protein